MNRIVLALLGVSCLILAGCAASGRIGAYSAGNVPDELRTKAELTAYAETGRYDEVVRFCRALDAASPYAKLIEFGTSGEGRPLPLLIVSGERAFTPAAVKRSGKPCVLVNCCIHPGECVGKDAALELARDLCLTREHAELLDAATLLILPIFSPDGHERFSPYSRINQNGPKEMGWRVTATNLNLNRDFTKADAVEMQAWLRMWNAWDPDLFFDLHTTNGSDHQYVLFYSATCGQLPHPAVSGWLREKLLPPVLTGVAQVGHLVERYGGPRDRADIGKGVDAWCTHTPRFSTGYGAVCNRPTILLEVHALKPYEVRVRSTYDFLRCTLEVLRDDPDSLREAVRVADAAAVAQRGGDGPNGEVVLRMKRGDEAEPLRYRGVEMRVEQSDITGGDVIRYGDKPVEIETEIRATPHVAEAIAPPAAYLVPRQWDEIIKRLDLHGVEYSRLAEPMSLDVVSYEFDEVEFAKRPFEGRFQPRFKIKRVEQTRSFPAGTVVVPMTQRRAKLAVHLLEPAAPDSLVRWGLLNAIFEQKEYAESYVMEPIARRMLAEDAELRAEFEKKAGE